MKELFIKLWNNKRVRDSVILTILTLIFVVILAVNLKKTNPKYSIKLLICKECREPETRSYVNIKTQLCNRCAKEGQMLYSFKCSKCDYEFGIRQISKNQIEGLSKRKTCRKE